MNLLLMMWEYFKTGLFSVGGGLATLPFLSKMGEKYGWFTQEELANMLAVSESTPGPIGVNMATYVGNTVGGVFGGVLATFSLVLPSFLVIYLVSRIMDKFRDSIYVQGAMKTMRPASVGMVAAAVLSVLIAVLLRQDAIAAMQWSRMIVLPNLLLFAILLAVYLKFNKMHPIFLLAMGAAAGMIFRL